MRADISTSKSDIGQCKGCGDICCLTCKNMETAQKFQMGKNIPSFLQCQLQIQQRDLPFGMWYYRVCMLQYVGEIIQSFNKCMNDHRSDIKCKLDMPLSRHILSHSHTEYRSFAKTQNQNNWKQPKHDERSRQYRERFG